MGRREFEADGSRLRTARREHLVSLTDFASRVGYSRSYLSAVELGHLPETEQIVLAYEAALGLERGSLTEGKQSVARILHRVGQLPAGESSAGTPEVSFEEGRLVPLRRPDVVLGMVSLANQLVASGARPGEVFVSSFSEGEDWRGGGLDLWAAAQYSLLRAGWTINRLIRLNEDVGRSLLLMESMLGLLTTDAGYRALYAPAGAAMPVNIDYFVAPGNFALVRFDTEDEDRQAVVLYRDQASVQALLENCRLLQQQMKPLIEAISREDPEAFEAHLEETEQAPGERVLVRDGFSTATESNGLPEIGWLPPVELPALDPEPTGRYVSRRQDRFVATVKRHKVRHIYLKERIEQLVSMSREVGEGLLLTDGGERFQPVNVKRVIEQFADMLRRYDNYEMALLDPDEVSLIQAPGSDSVVYWLVQGNKLLLESWPRVASGEARHLHIAVHEASIALAFMEHFKNVWARVTPLHREKKYVLWWLEQQMASLEPYT